MLLQSADCLITPCVRDLDPGVYSGGGGGGSNSSSSEHAVSAHYAPGTLLSISYVLSHFIKSIADCGLMMQDQIGDVRMHQSWDFILQMGKNRNERSGSDGEGKEAGEWIDRGKNTQSRGNSAGKGPVAGARGEGPASGMTGRSPGRAGAREA